MTADRDFPYIEVAVGGVHNHNRIVPITQFQPGAQLDSYASVLRFPVDLLKWRDSHRNGNGRGTVAGYDGPALATFLPFDFDDAENPARALRMAQESVRILRDRYGVPVEAVRFFHSGAKGFHLEVPATLFGGFEPSGHIASHLKRLAALLFPYQDGIAYDRAIYEKLRLWRWPNTRHSSTGLYKVPLTTEELLTLTLDQVRMLARAPRTVERPVSSAPAIPRLAELWRLAMHPGSTMGLPSKASRSVSSPVNRYERTICEGGRNSSLASLAGSLRRLGLSEDAMIAALTIHNEERCLPPLPKSEVIRIAASVSRYPAGTGRSSGIGRGGLLVREVQRAGS